MNNQVKTKMHVGLLIISIATFLMATLDVFLLPVLRLTEGVEVGIILQTLVSCLKLVPILLFLVYALVRGKSPKSDGLVFVAYLLYALFPLVTVVNGVIASACGYFLEMGDAEQIFTRVWPQIMLSLACLAACFFWTIGMRHRTAALPAAFLTLFPFVVSFGSSAFYPPMFAFSSLDSYTTGTAFVMTSPMFLLVTVVSFTATVLTATMFLVAGVGRKKEEIPEPVAKEVSENEEIAE